MRLKADEMATKIRDWQMRKRAAIFCTMIQSKGLAKRVEHLLIELFIVFGIALLLITLLILRVHINLIVLLTFGHLRASI